MRLVYENNIRYLATTGVKEPEKNQGYWLEAFSLQQTLDSRYVFGWFKPIRFGFYSVSNVIKLFLWKPYFQIIFTWQTFDSSLHFPCIIWNKAKQRHVTISQIHRWCLKVCNFLLMLGWIYVKGLMVPRNRCSLPILLHVLQHYTLTPRKATVSH